VKIAKVEVEHSVGASSVTWRLRWCITRRLGGGDGWNNGGKRQLCRQSHRREATLHKVEDDPREVEAEASRGEGCVA
jgi:hypothetical protein